MTFPELDQQIKNLVSIAIANCGGKPDSVEVDLCATIIEHLAAANAGALKLEQFISTGETREPRLGEWFRCGHPECQSPNGLHQAEPTCFPYPPREIFAVTSEVAGG